MSWASRTRRALARWLPRARHDEVAPAAPPPGESWTPSEPLTRGHEHGQWVESERADLSALHVLLATPGGGRAAPVELRVQHDPSDAAPIRSVWSQAGAIANNAFHAFPFEPIPDSAGKTYYVSLRAPEASPASAVAIWRRPAWGERAVAVADGRPTRLSWRYLCQYGEAPAEEPADFGIVSRQFLDYLAQHAGLRPESRILEVGCGRGSWALPLAGYLTGAGFYRGFDVDAASIQRCHDLVGARDPRFQFQVADVWNKRYNPGGSHKASEYVFPYDGAGFDLVFLISVFTHLLREDVDHYLAEIGRVLKPGGYCLGTFFLLNAESREAGRAGKSDVDFRHVFGDWATTDPDLPESAVAYDEAFVRGLYESRGLSITRIDHGWWSGRGGGVAYQDLIVARKPAACWEGLGNED